MDIFVEIPWLNPQHKSEGMLWIFAVDPTMGKSVMCRRRSGKGECLHYGLHVGSAEQEKHKLVQKTSQGEERRFRQAI